MEFRTSEEIARDFLAWDDVHEIAIGTDDADLLFSFGNGDGTVPTHVQYLLRAVNSHDRLVEACRYVADEIGTTADITDSQAFIDETLSGWLERLDAALADATKVAT